MAMAVLLLSSGTTWAGLLEDGVAAAERGDNAIALSIFRQLVAQGNGFAQFNLGSMYAQGQGVTQDYAEAGKWFRLAAERGNAGAQSNIGLMYAKGYGVTQDYAKAAEWYQRAAAQGDAVAQLNLGLM